MSRLLLWGLVWLSMASEARADSSPGHGSDHYAGLQLAPSVHAGVAHGIYFAGVGAELSFTKRLLAELAVSGMTPPGGFGAYYDMPGAVQVSLGVYSRAGGDTHTFVYGLGMSYTNRYECPGYCFVFSALGGPEEDRVALDLLSLDIGLGYEARLPSSFFLRGMAKLELPIYLGDQLGRDGYDTTSMGADHEPMFYLTRLTVQLTVGYAFEVPL